MKFKSDQRKMISKTKLLIALISVFTLHSCTEKMAISSGEIVQFQVNVEGIDGSEEVIAKESSLRERSMSASITPRQPTPSTTQETGGFVFESSSRQESMEAPIDDTQAVVSENLGSFSTVGRATTPMQTGITYRILLYNRATGVLWRTVQARAGRAVSIEAERGVTYSWYAYSYNTAEDLPAPTNLRNPTIETSIEKDFLYGSGETTIPLTGDIVNFNIGVILQHRVAQLRITANSSSLALYGAIHNLNAAFDRNDYIKKGVFNIRGNQISQIEVVPTETIFNGPSATNTWERSYYTVDPAAVSSYRIVLHDLPVTFFGVNPNIANRNLATYNGVNNKPTRTYTFDRPALGQRLNSIMRLNYQPDALRLVHYSNDNNVGYSMQMGPSWDFLNSRVNFGDLPESVVKLGTANGGVGGWIGGTATANSANNRFGTTAGADRDLIARLAANNPNRPDIVIIGWNATTIRQPLGVALNEYLDNNGVVVMLLQGADDAATKVFFDRFFGGANITLNTVRGSAGAMFPIVGNDPNDVLLNGPFGDVRGQYWGDDAGPSTLGLTNIPESQVTIYSFNQAINRASVGATRAVTMFKHNTKSLFFVGDGGFVAYQAGERFDRFPFRYNEVTKRPLPKAFGDRFTVNREIVYQDGSRDAYNSVIMANVMAWAVRKAELEGVRTWRYAAPPRP